MKNILRHFRIGLLYFLQALKVRMEYRVDFFVECLAALLQQASGLLVLTFLFNHFTALKDWRREDVFFIYGFSLLPMAFFDSFSQSFYMFSDKYIVSGELDRLLLRPLNSLFQLIMEGISFDFLADLALGIGVLAYAWRVSGPVITPLVIVQFILCVFGAWGVVTGVFLALTAVAFWSQDRLSFMPPVYNLLNFARYPLNIYKPFVQILLTWVIPFGFVAFYPASAFLRNGELYSQFSRAVPLAGLLLLMIGIGAWHLGVRKYSGAGS